MPASPAGVGEGLRERREAEAEDSKQRAIRCTEEVVRREEEEKRERALEAAKEEWARERQQLFVEAHQSQLRAIARQSAILEERLRKEFADKLKEVAEEKRRHLVETVERTWSEADGIREVAVQAAREEERESAADEARRVREIVEEEKRAARERALQELSQALASQQTKMVEEKERALEEQRSSLSTEFEARLSRVRTECDAKYRALQEEHDSQLTAGRRLEEELQRVTDEKEEWEERHAQLRAEFSDFIDKVPGFRGEFLLK